MFRRQTCANGDIVAAAQRRLAALADQHANARGASSPSPTGTSDRATGPIIGQPAVADPRHPRLGRHSGTRRTEFGRWGVTGQHVTVVALLVVVLVVLVAWWALRSVPHAESVPVTSQRRLPTGTVSGSAPSAGSASTTPFTVGGPAASSVPGQTVGSARLVVDVAGKVRRPGIVELPSGSRVVDAIAAAGGPRPGVALTRLNLARLLVDGEQIVVGLDIPYVGGAPPPPVATSGIGTTTGTIAPVDLNTATAEQLDTLPGIGPVTAQAILRWRTDNGPFTNVDDLLEVSGIGDATLSDLRPYAYV